MLLRSPLLAFLGGGILLFLGVILLLAAEPWAPTTMERWEDRERSEDGDPRGALFMGSALIILGLVLTVPPMVQWVSQGAFAEAVLEPPEEGAPLGGETVVRVRLVPRRALRVASAELRLISEEQAQYMEEASGPDNERHYRARVMELHRWSTRLEVPLELNAPLELEVPIPIPRELPPTFAWDRHMARTRLELEVVLVGRMDLHLEKELIVLPRLAASGVGA
jgi:hypothetical protein